MYKVEWKLDDGKGHETKAPKHLCLQNTEYNQAFSEYLSVKLLLSTRRWIDIRKPSFFA